VLSRRVCPPERALQRIPIDTRPIDEPQRIGLEISSCCWIVVSHPVLVQARFHLEPLAGEAEGDGGAGGGADAAEGEVARGPDDSAGVVGGEGRAADVIGAEGSGLATCYN
jgi:hypothetical protein